MASKPSEDSRRREAAPFLAAGPAPASRCHSKVVPTSDMLLTVK